MRRLNTSPLKSAIRGTGPGRLLDDVMSRFAVNSETRDEDSHSGEEESTHGRDHEAEEDERDRSVTPPPLIPNPPWMVSPAPKTPENRADSDDEVGLMLEKPMLKQTSICISPNSSHLHVNQPTFMTPARAIGSGPRPFDTSFPPFPPLSSPIRHPPASSDPVTPNRPSSSYGSIFMQTPLFPSSFSDTRLEDELARMARGGEDSPGTFFDRSAFYRSPSVPGSSPNRWANQ